jgi:hypothetical protein
MEQGFHFSNHPPKGEEILLLITCLLDILSFGMVNFEGRVLKSTYFRLCHHSRTLIKVLKVVHMGFSNTWTLVFYMCLLSITFFLIIIAP